MGAQVREGKGYERIIYRKDRAVHELRYEAYALGFIWFCSCGESWKHPQLSIEYARDDAREHIGRKPK